MSSDLCSQIELLERIHKFVMVGACNELTEEQWVDFERLLRENDEACRLYCQYVDVSVLLPAILSSISNDESPTAHANCPAGQQEPVFHVPPLSFLNTVYHGTVGFFSQEVPFSILIATLVFALGGIIGSMITVHEYTQFAGQSQTSSDRSFATKEGAAEPVASTDQEKKIVFVGRITGMVDCKWSDDRLAPIHDRVILGAKYALVSGLIEITYKTGTKVILQGPCAYTAESTASGFLSLGKLTARVEKKEEEKSPTQQSAFPLPPSPLFAVRTPTAVVTDLGTEFGVEVLKSGRTESRVFRGKVKVAVLAAAGSRPTEGREVVLGENEWVRVDVADGTGVPELLEVRHQTAEQASAYYVLNLKQYNDERVIGVNFTHGKRSQLDAEERTGVVDAAHWNNADAWTNPSPVVELHNSAGKSSGAKLTWQWSIPVKMPTWHSIEQAWYGREKLLDGRFSGNPGNNSGPWPSLTLRIAGVPYARYRAYVYYWMEPSPNPNDLHTFGLAVNGGVPIAVGRPKGFLNDFYRYRDEARSGNYQVFTGLTGDLAIAATPEGSATKHELFIAGLQIVGELSSGGKIEP